MKATPFRILFAVLLSVLSLGAAAQDTFLWPIQGKTAGEDILYRPQEYIGREQNSDKLFIAAPLGTEVVAPADGTVEVYAVGYIPQLHQISLGPPRDGVENHFDAMIADFLEEEKDLPVPSQYVCGFLTIRLNDGRKLHLNGLRGNVVYKTGMAVRRGDVLGTVGYYYRGIKEPHISLSLSDTQSNADDPMKPFGLRSTFIPPKEAKAPETLTRAQALEDFGVLTACLQEAYPSLYDIIDREEFAANDSTVRARLSEKEEISYREFYFIIERFMGYLHDSHLSIKTPDPIEGSRDAYIPNLWLTTEGDSTWISQTHPAYRRYRGRRVTAIDGEEISARLERLGRGISGADGDNRNWVARRFISGWGVHYGDSLLWPRTTVVTLDDGKTVEDVWKPVAQSEIFSRMLMVGQVDYHRRDSRNYNFPYTFKVLNDSVGYFSLSYFDLNETQIEQLKDSLAPLFRLPYMVVDMRYNWGGDGRVMQQLLAWFLQEPSRPLGSYSRVTKPGPFRSFAHCTNFDSTIVVFPEARRVEGKEGYIFNDSAVSLLPDTAFNYKGKLYVLTDETSVSAATLFPATLVRNHRAVTVGRETRSGYHYMTAVKFANLCLPHSFIMLRIPLVQVVFDPLVTERTPWNRGLLPDYPVPVTRQELLYSPRDTILNHTLQLIAEGKYLGPDPFPGETTAETTEWPMKATWIVLVLLTVYIILRLTLFRKRTT